jgi:hypothetical protein
MLFIQGFIKFDQGISEKCVGQTFEGRKKERKKKKKKKKKKKQNPPFCFHGNCSKVCPTDSICLAYLVSLDVDVVPIKFHQFLFGE